MLFGLGSGDPVVGGVSAVVGYGVGKGVLWFSRATRSWQQTATEPAQQQATAGATRLLTVVGAVVGAVAYWPGM